MNGTDEGSNREQPIRDFAGRLAELLDKVSQRRGNGPAVAAELRGIGSDPGIEPLSDATRTLLAQAQGFVGGVNASEPDSASEARAYSNLTTFKNELRALAAGR